MMIAGSRLKILLLIAVAAVVVSMYQWIELIKLSTGAPVALCALDNAWMDCVKVLNSPLSADIQRYTLLPVPAWGVLWGVAVIVMIFRVVFLRRQGSRVRHQSFSQGLCLLVLAAGLIATVLLVYSLFSGNICLVCLVFYALVYAAFVMMLRDCKAPVVLMGRGAVQLPAVLISIYLLLLYPAWNTPSLDATHAPVIGMADKARSGQEFQDEDFLQHPLAKYLQSLSVDMQHTLSVALFIYRTSPYVEPSLDKDSLLFGPADAPVNFVGWVDMHNCPQCRYLEESLFKLRRATAKGSWNYTIRHFPVASQCNPYINIEDPTGVSCLGAKMLICTRNAATNDLLRLNFYRNMSALTPEIMWKMTRNAGINRTFLEQCIHSAETNSQLLKDIEDARSNFIRGVPMIAVNGRKATFHPAFLYSLILAEGRDDHPGYSVMAPPSSPNDK